MALQLSDNHYNRAVGRSVRQFKLWHSAGLMLTYWCPSRCACCYNFSGPVPDHARAEMDIDLALHCWQSLIDLAGERALVHLTGGEPFADFDRLAALLERAAQLGLLNSLEKIETNAYWCTDPALVRQRFSWLKKLGVKKLQISTDVYHQAYIPLEAVQMGSTIGTEIFGRTETGGGLQIRWRDFLADPIQVATLPDKQRQNCYIAEMQKRPERMVGRAAHELAKLKQQFPAEKFQQQNCLGMILGAKHVHIDGWANLFLGTCVGIIAGSVREIGLDALWQSWDWREHPVFSLLAEQGPWGLANIARQHGYVMRSGYAGRCHLCYDVRRYLAANGILSDYLGPPICYGTCD